MAGEGIGGGIAGGLLGLTGSIISDVNARRFQTRQRRRQRGAIDAARQFADEASQRVAQGQTFRLAEQFLQNTFSDTADNPLVADFAKRLSATQASRGTFFGGAGAIDAAGGAAGFLQQQRQSLLPIAQQFAEGPERLRQSILAQEAPLRIASATGALPGGLSPAPENPQLIANAINQSIAGAAGGFQFGSEIQERNRFASAQARREESGMNAERLAALSQIIRSFTQR